MAVQGWIDEVRFDPAVWAGFRAAFATAGLEQMADPLQQHKLDEQLRQVMGVLVTKYVHATLIGLVRHTQLLVAKDQAESQALRDVRRSEAVRCKGRKAGKAGAQPGAVAAAVEAAAAAEAAAKVAATCCEICDRPEPEDTMLMCDANCGTGWHTFCLRPALVCVPEGDWFCPNCVNAGHTVGGPVGLTVPLPHTAGTAAVAPVVAPAVAPTAPAPLPDTAVQVPTNGRLKRGVCRPARFRDDENEGGGGLLACKSRATKRR